MSTKGWPVHICASPIVAQQAAGSLVPLPMGPGPAIGGSAGPVLLSHVVQQPDAPLTRLLLIYEDDTSVGTPSSHYDTARHAGEYATDGDMIVKLAPSILATYHVLTQARSIKSDDLTALRVDNMQHERMPVLLLKDSGTQDGFRATLKISASLIVDDGAPIWTSSADASFMGRQWGKRDVYAQGQYAVVDALLRKIAADLHDKGIIG
ncbi:TPA: hypothetical protein ACK3Q6_003213 [Burkholderia cepacia]|uniref:hypothetical protein n=1 Tax=Burkholderia cepacia TaxID=292 RepID=UPI001CF17843|nr:hypothetical protein [Burkholderia cepacia]MCA8358202.1 hypothetical protein [Burkholderia cepacia]HDR9759536.1 hypothetical protein [Burkholderia cepacia ATCC 25416]HDV6365827.1 hypothetical protein [Burkholderia cepacia]